MAKVFIRLPQVGPMMLRATTTRLAQTANVLSLRNLPDVMVAEATDELLRIAEMEGAKVYPDIQFQPLPPKQMIQGDDPQAIGGAAEYWQNSSGAASAMMSPPTVGLNQVMTHINAPQAWHRTRGAGATIVVIDTGVCGTSPEVGPARRSTLNFPSAYAGRHWQDTRGHGSMCAIIAAASQADGGRYSGVAPEATVLSARTDFLASDLVTIYDQIVTWKRDGTLPGPVVASNSYGLYQCHPSGLPQDHPYLDSVLDAVTAGVTVVFAAGNNHADVKCKHPANASGPNTIWAINSHDEVLSVGTIDRNNSNTDPATEHRNSSRGPGEWAVNHPKPDCVAPTYGEVAWGCGYQVMGWWGTSGACPQVAGLAALIMSLDPALPPSQVADIIRSTCRPIGGAPTCIGHGLIDCGAAVAGV